ncbi:hypothetical protein [Cupriavidus pauculus]|jgi:hypothetical protein|uniref:hypothetical protein n=1 Tax=Cupriavidus pauculus TaxID=82633 RepID=UPI0030FB7E56
MPGALSMVLSPRLSRDASQPLPLSIQKMPMTTEVTVRGIDVLLQAARLTRAQKKSGPLRARCFFARDCLGIPPLLVAAPLPLVLPLALPLLPLGAAP